MTALEFASNKKPTIGVELELGLVDLESMNLSSSFDALAERLPDRGAGRFKPEIIQSVVEINTDVCDSVREIESELRGRLGVVEAAADTLGLTLWWGGLHPFARCSEQQVTQDDRYERLVNQLQILARRMVTLGLHVHVGVDSGDKAVMVCDRILRHLPTLLALSSSSPFWEGSPTGLHSYRSKVMELLPTAGLPPMMRNWSEYVWLVNHMVSTGFIETIRELWWDVRPHHNFGTVEIRMCDMPGNLTDTLALAALMHCLVKSLSDEIDEGAYQHDSHPLIVRQNKWRASRYGIRAQLVDSLSFESRSVRQIVDDLATRLAPTAEELGCTEHLEQCRAMAAGPSWAERQLELVETGHSFESVMRQLTEQSRISAPTSVQQQGKASVSPPHFAQQVGAKPPTPTI